MAFRSNPPVAGSVDNLVEISDSEEASTDILSINDDGPAEKEANNRKLTQAIDYLQQEGGDDSPSTFIDRVNRINETLLNQLPRQGQTFDQKLYRRVRVMVMDVERDYRDAAEGESSFLESSDVSPQYGISAAANEALYRDSSSSPSPTPIPATARTQSSKALASRRPGSDDNVQRERRFKYGGPGNEPENWHKDFPAILPFPETHMMAHWESMKIDYDLARAKGEKNAKTDVPLEHGELQPYLNLSQYESGSRFKLPAVSTETQESINKYGGVHILKNDVNKWNESDTSEKNNKYAPRVFLEKFEVGHQFSPRIINQIRASLANTPSKPRAPRVPSGGMAPTKRSSLPLIENGIYDTDNTPAARPEAEIAAPVSRVSMAPVTHSRTSEPQAYTSPAFRRISKEVRHATGEDKLPKEVRHAESPYKPVSISPKPTPTPTPRRTATHVAIPKRGRGHPRKNPLPSTTAPPIANTPPIHSTFGKRKPSIGSQPYTEPTSSIKKTLRETKKRRISVPMKHVAFFEYPTTLAPDSEDPDYTASPVRKITRESVSVSGSKASAAGKLAKKHKEAKEAVAFRKGTTRSGATYTPL